MICDAALMAQGNPSFQTWSKSLKNNVLFPIRDFALSYTRVHAGLSYPTRVYLLKHLKNIYFPLFRAVIAGLPAGSPVSARGPTVPNQLLTKQLLWRGYKKTSMGRPRRERREQDHNAEIFPLDQV